MKRRKLGSPQSEWISIICLPGKRREKGVEDYVFVLFKFHPFNTFTHKHKDLEYGSLKSSLFP